VKAFGLLQKTYTPNRVLYPMKRTNPNKGREHDSEFARISSNEALDLVPDRLRSIFATAPPNVVDAATIYNTFQETIHLYFGDTEMTNKAATAKSETRQIVIKEIEATWGKFSEQDLSALKNKDDLVTQLVAKYGREKSQAQRDVDALLKGRQF
jgi:anaerobic selenocysteine-containing dehydrogenase